MKFPSSVNDVIVLIVIRKLSTLSRINTITYSNKNLNKMQLMKSPSSVFCTQSKSPQVKYIQELLHLSVSKSPSIVTELTTHRSSTFANKLL